TRAAVERGLAGGVGTVADLGEAETFAAEVQRARISTEGALHETSIQLSVAMGREASSELETRGAPPSPELPGELEASLERAAALPRAEALRFTALAARAREREERAVMGPLLAVGAQVQHEPPTAWTALGTLGLSLH